MRKKRDYKVILSSYISYIYFVMCDELEVNQCSERRTWTIMQNGDFVMIRML